MWTTTFLAACWAFSCLVVAELAFLDKEYLITQGEPFTIHYSGCKMHPCLLSLHEASDTDNNDPVKEITNNATGMKYTCTLDFITRGKYVFHLAHKDDHGSYATSPEFGLNGPEPDAPTPTEPSPVEPIPTQTNDASDISKGLGFGVTIAIMTALHLLLSA